VSFALLAASLLVDAEERQSEKSSPGSTVVPVLRQVSISRSFTSAASNAATKVGPDLPGEAAACRQVGGIRPKRVPVRDHLRELRARLVGLDRVGLAVRHLLHAPEEVVHLVIAWLRTGEQALGVGDEGAVARGGLGGTAR
jgi:hypothetical protein